MSHDYISDIAFSDSVKKQQAAQGSRAAYQRMAEKRDWQKRVTPRLRAFIEARDSFYMASVNADGHPYVQHRGGYTGFLKIIDEQTLAFADYSGNSQYISVGNFDDNNKVHLILMDYPNRARIKVWGEVEVLDKDHPIRERLEPPEYPAPIERIISIKITAWDINCPQHIQPRFTLEELEPHIEVLKAQIRELEAQVKDCGLEE